MCSAMLRSAEANKKKSPTIPCPRPTTTKAPSLSVSSLGPFLHLPSSPATHRHRPIAPRQHDRSFANRKWLPRRLSERATSCSTTPCPPPPGPWSCTAPSSHASTPATPTPTLRWASGRAGRRRPRASRFYTLSSVCLFFPHLGLHVGRQARATHPNAYRQCERPRIDNTTNTPPPFAHARC